MLKYLPHALLTACLVAGFLQPEDERPGNDYGKPASTLGLEPESVESVFSAPAEKSLSAGAPGLSRNVVANGDAPPVAVDTAFWRAAFEIEASSDPQVREQAVYLLEDIGSGAATVAIESALADPNPAVREAAIDALAEIGDAAATQILIHAYFSDTEELREEIIHALAEVGGPGVGQLLLAASRDSSAVVRNAALAYLATN